MADVKPQDPEKTLEEIRALNEKILEYAQHADSVYLDTYEQVLKAFSDFQSAAAESTDDKRSAVLMKAWAQFTREVTSAYMGAARELRG